MKPMLLSESKNSAKDLETLKKTNKIWKVIDIYGKQEIELFMIRNPNLDEESKDFKKRITAFIRGREGFKNYLKGVWIYYPWSGILMHTLIEKEFFELRTNRNRNLINKREQELLYKTPVGIAGLSIGGGIASTLVYQGMCKRIALADYDDLETTNLNRIKASIADIGDYKLDIISREIYEINPFADLELFGSGLNDNNIDSFFLKTSPRVVFEAIDDLRMKILIRTTAKKYKVPVVMLTNLGDRVMVDVERYDCDDKLKVFNGLDPKIVLDIVSHKVKKEEINKYVLKIVGVNNIPERTINSVKEVGKTLMGRPQLVSTVTISSGLASYIARQIIVNGLIGSGRYLIKLNSIFGVDEL